MKHDFLVMFNVQLNKLGLHVVGTEYVLCERTVPCYAAKKRLTYVQVPEIYDISAAWEEICML